MWLGGTEKTGDCLNCRDFKFAANFRSFVAFVPVPVVFGSGTGTVRDVELNFMAIIARSQSHVV